MINNLHIVLVLLFIVVLYVMVSKSSFNPTLNTTPNVTDAQPRSFPAINKPEPDNANQSGDVFKLETPDVPEEIGLYMAYPQGSGVGMSSADSNSFYPDKPGPLLTDHVGPESYGESSLADPSGFQGADQGCRVLKLKGTGNQLVYKPLDETTKCNFSAAYTPGEFQKGATFINGVQPFNYTDSFNPESNLILQTSPGQQSTLTNCESTYPNVVKYKDMCITAGDIPYGQVVDGKVNPRLVSRWESFTGDYSRKDALSPIDGVLYPDLGVLTQ
jgi:hypothetical protein